MPIQPIPTLTSEGWVSEPYKKADFLLGHFFVSEASQSNTFAGNISSLPYLVQNFGSTPKEFALAVENNVTTLFNRYYVDTAGNTTISVKASIKNADDSSINRYELVLDASIIINGVNYVLGRVVDVENSIIKNISDLNNG